jgi:membrane associated rhomboid family serine protease
MPRIGASPFAFPDFHGATRRLVLLNLFAFFALLLLQLASSAGVDRLTALFAFIPSAFLHGALWQPLTYSFIHAGLLGTLFELLSLWFVAGFLENAHSATWVTGLYATSVLGTALAAICIFVVAPTLGIAVAEISLYGCLGGIFGLLAAIGYLYGDVQFLLFFVVAIKAKYLVAIYALISVAMLFGQQKMYAFAQLGGALAGLVFIRVAPRRGISFAFSEQWYGLRNRYYRFKRRRAARKFEVYMRSQGRTVRFDGRGKQLDDDPDDKKRWN